MMFHPQTCHGVTHTEANSSEQSCSLGPKFALDALVESVELALVGSQP